MNYLKKRLPRFRVKQLGPLLAALSYLFSPLNGQITPYFGEVSFDYSGATLNGHFQGSLSAPPDTLALPASAGLGAVYEPSDTTHLLLSAFQQADSNAIDLFFIYLRDDSGGVEPQSWTLPANPLDPNVLLGFIPNVDSTIIINLVSLFGDSLPDSTIIDALLNYLLVELLDQAYMGVSGTITLDTVSMDTLGGIFNATAMTGTFPPNALQIFNGRFNLSSFIPPALGVDPAEQLPQATTLDPAYPNPFNARTTIHFVLGNTEAVRLSVYDLTGKTVAVLAEGTKSPGSYSYTWSAASLASGLYFLQLRTHTTVLTRKVLLLK